MKKRFLILLKIVLRIIKIRKYILNYLIKEKPMIIVDMLNDKNGNYIIQKAINLEDEEYDLNEMIYQASINHDYVEDVKALIPNYIKGVEVSKKHDR